MQIPGQAQLNVQPLPLCLYGHPVLAEKSVPVTEITDEIREFAARMIVTMHENDGIGLAAPQVGRSIRLIVVDIPPPEPGDGDPPSVGSPGEALLMNQMPVALVNPVLSGLSEETVPYNEGCLSIPDIRGPVERPVYIDLDAQLLTGERLQVRCGGLLARCLQHEVDHLNGVLFVELVPPDARQRIDPKLRKLNKQTQAALKKERARRR